jgi:hypothetical protein
MAPEARLLRALSVSSAVWSAEREGAAFGGSGRLGHADRENLCTGLRACARLVQGVVRRN